jgi:hypothetical protein
MMTDTFGKSSSNIDHDLYLPD